MGLGEPAPAAAGGEDVSKRASLPVGHVRALLQQPVAGHIDDAAQGLEGLGDGAYQVVLVQHDALLLIGVASERVQEAESKKGRVG